MAVGSDRSIYLWRDCGAGRGTNYHFGAGIVIVSTVLCADLSGGVASRYNKDIV